MPVSVFCNERQQVGKDFRCGAGIYGRQLWQIISSTSIGENIMIQRVKRNLKSMLKKLMLLKNGIFQIFVVILLLNIIFSVQSVKRISEKAQEPGFTFIKKGKNLKIYHDKGSASGIQVEAKLFLTFEYGEWFEYEEYEEYDDSDYINGGIFTIELYDYFSDQNISYDAENSSFCISDTQEGQIKNLVNELNYLLDKYDYMIDSTKVEKYYTIMYYNHRNIRNEKIYVDRYEYDDVREKPILSVDRIEAPDMAIPTVLSSEIRYSYNVSDVEYDEQWYDYHGGIKEDEEREDGEEKIIENFISKIVVKNGMLKNIEKELKPVDLDSAKIEKITKTIEEYLDWLRSRRALILFILVVFIAVGILIKWTGISLNTRNMTLLKGGTGTLIAKWRFGPVQWSSNDTSVATVSNGIVEAVEKGNAKITVSTKMHEKTCNIKVIDPQISDMAATLAVSHNKQLYITGNEKDVKWESSNEDVVSVDRDGYITAVSQGNAVITGKILNKKLTCTVTVVSSDGM